MTPTREAIGTDAKRGAAATIPIARNSAILTPDNLLFPPPLWTLIILCPKSAQPPIPPANPDTRFPRPCPKHSLFVDPLFLSSAIPSKSCIVSRDSIAPTAAIVIAYGKTILTVSIENGTFGKPIVGRTENPPRNVSAPEMSARVLTGNLNIFAMMDTIVTAPRDGGTFLNTPIFGKILTNSIVRPVRPYIALPAALFSDKPLKCDICALNMTTVRPLTKPSMTGCGTNLINFPNPNTPPPTI
mmetsp:Transcript_1234/g.1753  ORF Transcript_1234/g.1753 Transcript_1234/m.1753 type:complete len:243 (-) Transcript_1234:709-1437(-)